MTAPLVGRLLHEAVSSLGAVGAGTPRRRPVGEPEHVELPGHVACCARLAIPASERLRNAATPSSRLAQIRETSLLEIPEATPRVFVDPVVPDQVVGAQPGEDLGKRTPVEVAACPRSGDRGLGRRLVGWPGIDDLERVARAVDRAVTRLTQARALLTRRGGNVVVVVPARDADGQAHLWSELHRLLSSTLPSTGGAIGVGRLCPGPSDLPRSYSQALRALGVRQSSARTSGVTTFDELGLYRMLGSNREVGEFIREWLGPLLDYESRTTATWCRRSGSTTSAAGTTTRPPAS